MTKIIKPLPTNPYEKFRYDLERESPRAAYWLESMIFGILAQMDGMTEDVALELACKIVLHDTEKKNRVRTPQDACNGINPREHTPEHSRVR